MTLHFVSMYSEMAGSTRVRLYDWARHLGRRPIAHQYAGLPNAGVGTVLGNFSKVARAEVELRGLQPQESVVVMSREASPFSRGGVESRLLRSASRGVYDLDDALFNDDSPRRRAFGGARKFARAAGAADHVIVGNAYLADWASQFASSVTVIPSCVEPRDYVLATPGGRERPVLVWLGSSSTEQYLTPLIPDLLTLHREHGARLKLISSPAENPALAELKPMLDRVAWTADSVARELADADIALAPLIDTPYARGKCAYKILQYAASGLPVVGSPVGANDAALRHVSGLAVHIDDDWVDPISSILDQPSVAAAMGRRGPAAIAEHYSFAAWQVEWQKAVFG